MVLSREIKGKMDHIVANYQEVSQRSGMAI